MLRLRRAELARKWRDNAAGPVEASLRMIERRGG